MTSTHKNKVGFSEASARLLEMKKFIFGLLAVFAVSSVHAQNTPPALPAPASTICFVNSQRVLAAHPKGAAVIEAQQKAQLELKEISDRLQALQIKISNGTATATERQLAETLQKTGQARQTALKTQIDKMLEPITREVDAAVAKIAPQKGCGVVLDREIASRSGLFVWVNASTTLDISEDVIAELKPKT
jgi:outer membrane protein